MTEWTRRAVLAGSASGLAAVAGCSDVPVVGGGDGSVEYDGDRLRELADPSSVPAAAAYPGVVPDRLAVDHYERARELLADVPEQPSVPNDAVADRLATEREQTASDLADPPDGVSAVDALDGWRYDREEAATVRGAYAAATGDASESALDARRSRIREDLAAFRGDWAYRADTAVDAFAVHRHVETLVTRCRDRLAPARAFPEDQRAAVFAVGELFGDVESARAALSDAAGLRDAHRTDGMPAHRSDVAVAARRLEAAIAPTRRRVQPYADRDASPEDFQRDVDGTPAERLFVEVRQVALGGIDSASAAEERGDYATAVTAASRALAGLLAMESAVDAIHDGEYGRPESTDAVVAAREGAFDAVDDALAVEPTAVAAVVAEPARWWLRDAEEALGERAASETGDETPDQRDVVRAVGHYALAEHVADAVSAVVDRVVTELESGGS